MLAELLRRTATEFATLLPPSGWPIAQGCFNPGCQRRREFSIRYGLRLGTSSKNLPASTCFEDGATASRLKSFTDVFPGLNQPWALGRNRYAVKEH